MKRLLCWLAVLIIVLGIWPGTARAEEHNSSASRLPWQETVNRLDLKEMEQFKSTIDGEISGYLENRSVREWLSDFMTGQWEFNPKEIADNLWRYFLREVLANSQLLGKIIVLAVIS
ncbi:MAG: stage III sporulation protein AE, partial [Bacillota bacterium]